MNVRRIEPQDLREIVSLIREFAEFEDLVFYCEVDEDKLYAAMFVDGAIVEGFVATDGDLLAGYTLFYRAFSSFRGELGVHVEDLYVREKYRGQGVGQMLLREVAVTARKRGLVRVDLLVSDRNINARAFYEKLGARCNSDERHFKFSDDAFIDLSK